MLTLLIFTESGEDVNKKDKVCETRQKVQISQIKHAIFEFIEFFCKFEVVFFFLHDFFFAELHILVLFESVDSEQNAGS